MRSPHGPIPPLSPGLDRRTLLQAGGLGAFGLTLPELFRRQAMAATPRPKKAKACILLFLLGAPPQQETWDPKPDSPVEARGDLKQIASATPGLMVGELMPLTAQRTNKIAVLRAAQTRDSAHSSSGYYMTTGRPHAPIGVENAKPGAPNDWPSLGAVIRKLKQGESALPAAITLPEQAENDGNKTWPGQDGGFLGRAVDPWLLHCDPSSATFEMPGLGLPAEVSTHRFDERRTLLDLMNRQLDSLSDPTAVDYQAHTQKAFDLIGSSTARRAFDLDREDIRVRDRYGRTRFGQSCLLARRLIEADVPLVRVNWTRLPNIPNNGTWDTHSKNAESMKLMMPMLDRAYSALLDDLSERGLLDDTLVVWTGEFGRTPKINGNGGRDHWGNVFSLALAGGGVRGGQVIGSSDALAAYPKDGRVLPEDIQATIFHALGIPTSAEIHDTLNRPLAVTRGEVIRGVF